MNNYYLNITKEERENILDKHKNVYDGYVTNYVKPELQQLYVQDFANDKGGITVNNKGVVTTYRNMNINEDVFSGSEFEPQDVHYEQHDMIGDGDDDLEHGTMESELDELYDDEFIKSRYPKDYKFNKKDFGKKYKLSKLKSGLDKIDTKDEVDDEKPDFDDIDMELVDGVKMDESKKQKLRNQLSESLNMFKRINNY